MRTALKILKIIILLHLAGGVILAPVFYYTFVISPKKSFQKAQEQKPYDVIIVPGVPFEKKRLSKIMEARVRWSVYLFQQGIAKNIIYSGSSVYSPYIEGKVMKLLAIGLCVPEENIFIESNAEHSTENLVYSYRIAQQQGFKKIALATDPLQSFILDFYDGKFDPPVNNIPIDFRVLKSLPHPEMTCTSDSAFVKDFVSIKEREGLWERLKGTMGKKLKPGD